ncbi:hypothetical protein BC943DRAFT_382926 [Umbelopsis sp. AD052]|nr:hypothetical protein BC943DRAFT_382926 [Umbelopsis sp. AD052]
MVAQQAPQLHELGIHQQHSHQQYLSAIFMDGPLSAVLLRVLKQRQRQQTIKSLRATETGETYTSPSKMLQHATKFYQNLYTPYLVNDEDITEVIQFVPHESNLSEAAISEFGEEITVSDLELLIYQSPKSKSPGLDGLPFELYQKHPKGMIKAK